VVRTKKRPDEWHHEEHEGFEEFRSLTLHALHVLHGEKDRTANQTMEGDARRHAPLIVTICDMEPWGHPYYLQITDKGGAFKTHNFNRRTQRSRRIGLGVVNVCRASFAVFAIFCSSVF